MMAGKLSVTAGLFDGTYPDPTAVDLSNVTFKYTCIPVANTNPPVKRHDWKINILSKKEGSDDMEEKSLSFCLSDPITVSGFSIKSKDSTLPSRIEEDTTLADRLERGQKISDKEDDKVGVTIACFLDETKPSHQAFIKFGMGIVDRLKDHIRRNPDKNLPFKAHEIDIQSPVKQSRNTGRYYFALHLSTSREMKGKTFPATKFFLNGRLQSLPWSRLVKSQFTTFPFFKLSSYGMTQKTASITMYANSCRKVDDISPKISAADRSELRRMQMLGETLLDPPVSSRVMTFEKMSDDAEREGSSKDDRESIEPTGDIVQLSSQ